MQKPPILPQSRRYGRYTPAFAQLRFHTAREFYRFRGAICGTGAGKTICGCEEVIIWALMYPDSVGYIFEPSYPMVRRILIPTLESEFLLGKPMGANPAILKFNKSEMRLDFKNGSSVHFVSLEDPERAEGPNIDYAMLDEGRLVRHFAISLRVIRRRLRGSIPSRNWPTGLWITTTPDAPGSELHAFLEHPKTRHPDSKVFRWSIYDNPFLPEDFIKDIERSHHGGLAERFIYGRFAAVGAGTIPFDYNIHVKPFEFDKRIHTVVYGVDFGWRDPSVIVVIAFDKYGYAHVVDEFYKRRITYDELLSELRNMQNIFGEGPVLCDPSQLQTIEWLKSHGINAIKVTAKRDEGIRWMAGYFPPDPYGRPKVLIRPQCVNLIGELQIYDETIKENDHAVDCLRYGLSSKMKKEGDVDAWILGGP